MEVTFLLSCPNTTRKSKHFYFLCLMQPLFVYRGRDKVFRYHESKDDIQWPSIHGFNQSQIKNMWVFFFLISRNFQNAKFEFATHQPLFTSCLENPMDGGAWWAAVHGVATSLTRPSDFTFTFHFPALEKEMATHSSVLAWRIAGMAEPGRLPSVGSHRVGHDWSDLAAAAIFHTVLVVKNPPARDGFDFWVGKTPWRRTGQLPPVFLPGKRILVGYSLLGRKTSDTTERLSSSYCLQNIYIVLGVMNNLDMI